MTINTNLNTNSSNSLTPKHEIINRLRATPLHIPSRAEVEAGVHISQGLPVPHNLPMTVVARQIVTMTYSPQLSSSKFSSFSTSAHQTPLVPSKYSLQQATIDPALEAFKKQFAEVYGSAAQSYQETQFQPFSSNLIPDTVFSDSEDEEEVYGSSAQSYKETYFQPFSSNLIPDTVFSDSEDEEEIFPIASKQNVVQKVLKNPSADLLRAAAHWTQEKTNIEAFDSFAIPTPTIAPLYEEY